MIIALQPTGDELADLRSLTEANLDNILDYTGQGILAYELPFSQQEFSLALQIKDLLSQGGRVLLLTLDSDISQELTLIQEV